MGVGVLGEEDTGVIGGIGGVSVKGGGMESQSTHILFAFRRPKFRRDRCNSSVAIRVARRYGRICDSSDIYFVFVQSSLFPSLLHGRKASAGYNESLFFFSYMYSLFTSRPIHKVVCTCSSSLGLCICNRPSFDAF